jgi:hypothetical protein
MPRSTKVRARRTRGSALVEAIRAVPYSTSPLADSSSRSPRSAAPASGRLASAGQLLGGGGVVLALARRPGQSGDDRVLGAYAGMDRVAGCWGVTACLEVVLGRGQVLLGLPQERSGVVALFSGATRSPLA